jgi:hypothetical protein
MTAEETPKEELMNATLKHYEEVSSLAHHWSSIIPEAIKQYFSTTLYAFTYNPMIHESGYITVSIHRTREGAEKVLEWHRNELLKEFNERIAEGRKIMEDEGEGKEVIDAWYDDTFGQFEAWKVEEIKILD